MLERDQLAQFQWYFENWEFLADPAWQEQTLEADDGTIHHYRTISADRLFGANDNDSPALAARH